MSDEREPVGSVAEEAAKLFAALQGWAKESGGEYADVAAGAASAASSLLDDVNEHIATGDKDCTYCPICRGISAVRATSPEVRQHLSAAASSLFQALSAAMATDPEGSASRKAPVEKIDLDEDWPDA